MGVEGRLHGSIISRVQKGSILKKQRFGVPHTMGFPIFFNGGKISLLWQGERRAEEKKGGGRI